MSPSAVPRAARQRRPSVAIAARVMVHGTKCSLQNVLSVARTLKYPLNLPAVDRCTVAIATVNADRADSAALTLRHTRGLAKEE